MAEIVEVRRDGVTLDLLVWERFGAAGGLVEAALALNPGLAALGSVLPLLTRVILPEPPAGTPVATASVVRLWD